MSKKAHRIEIPEGRPENVPKNEIPPGRHSQRGDMGVDWDADARRAAAAKYPYTHHGGFHYFADLVEPNDRVLDVGCQIASWIWAWRGLEPTVRYEGYDWSAPALKIAEERYGVSGKNVKYLGATIIEGKKLTELLNDPEVVPVYEPFNLDPDNLVIGAPAVFHHGDAKEMSFKDEFDIVFTHTFFQHTSIETKEAVVPRIAEALKPGGLLIIQENISYDSLGTWKGEAGWISFFGKSGFQVIRDHDIGGGGAGIIFRI